MILFWMGFHHIGIQNVFWMGQIKVDLKPMVKFFRLNHSKPDINHTFVVTMKGRYFPWCHMHVLPKMVQEIFPNNKGRL